jgi:hypothetical protein
MNQNRTGLYMIVLANLSVKIETIIKDLTIIKNGLINTGDK